MIIVYYRRRDTGKIVSHHLGKGHTLEELETLAASYNSRNGDLCVYVEEVGDDSLTAYLFDKREIYQRALKSAIQDAISTLESTIDLI